MDDPRRHASARAAAPARTPEDLGRLFVDRFVGADVVDMLHAASIAVVTGAPLHRLWHAVPPFPTTSEVWVDLLEHALERPRGHATAPA